MSNNTITRVAILWQHVTGYVHAALQGLLAVDGVELFVVQQSTQANTPFQATFDHRCRFIELDNPQADSTGWFDALLAFQPQVALITAKRDARYLRAARQLKQQGWIRAEVALLPPDLAGVTLLVTVRFGEESPSIYADFERQMRALAPVKQCYHTAGDGDYVLVVQLPNLRDYERWSIEQLMANPAIRRYDTVVVWSCKKFETSVDLDALGAK